MERRDRMGALISYALCGPSLFYPSFSQIILNPIENPHNLGLWVLLEEDFKLSAPKYQLPHVLLFLFHLWVRRISNFFFFIRRIPVAYPFPYISMHIKKSPLVWRIAANRGRTPQVRPDCSVFRGYFRVVICQTIINKAPKENGGLRSAHSIFPSASVGRRKWYSIVKSFNLLRNTSISK